MKLSAAVPSVGRLSRNIFAIVGVIAVLSMLALLLLGFIDRHGLCDKRRGSEASAGNTKASVYQFDCGAMGATRTYVMLSAPGADGWRQGDTILTLRGDFPVKDVQLSWKSDHVLVIDVPSGLDLEFVVSRTHGISIEVVKRTRPTPDVGFLTPRSRRLGGE